jgi:predicted DCC family thiol-disulfide oxidoreductase YuxK
MKEVKLFYDGGCYFCRNFALLSELKSQARVELVDLRKHHDIRRAFLAEGIDIDNSFVIEANGQRLLKNTAMSYLLVKLDYKRVARLFDSVILGPALYKALVFLRRTYLFIARIKPFKDAI